jgi:protein-disulfide isomerase
VRRTLIIAIVCVLSASAAVAQTAPAKAAKPTTVSAKKAAPLTAPAAAPVKSYGSSTAPITMEVFSDYQCPSCRNLYEGTLKQMITEYVAQGKVYLIHRDFPLSGHKYSGQAVRWANAAARLGEFPQVEAALYDNQASWDADGNMEKYIAAAMPAATFNKVKALAMSCDYPAPTSKFDGSNPLAGVAHPCALDVPIVQDIEMGYKIPVQATPTYVITYKGQKLPAGSGAVSWPILKQFFDSLLSQ